MTQIKNTTNREISTLGMTFPAGKSTPVKPDTLAALRKDRHFAMQVKRRALEVTGEASVDKPASKTAAKADPKPEPAKT